MSARSMARHHYEDAKTAHLYGERTDIMAAEAALLERFRGEIAGRRVLDVGCGGGRTSRWLADVAGSYVGLDYAARMVAECRARYPDLTFVQGDATTLADVATDSVDVVLFSYNGIDTMSHAMRLRVFEAIGRVLVPGGLFAFSSHNRDWTERVRMFDPNAGFSPGALLRNVRHLYSFARVRHLEDVTSEYAVRSDPRAGSRQLSYFISAREQLAQLERAGFGDVTVFDWDGEASDPAVPDTRSMSIYYVCRNARHEEARS